MAAITDLTWQNLADELPENSLQVSDGTTALSAGLYVNLSNLTGDTISALTDSGVLEALLKLFYGGLDAQTTVNVGVAAGDQLNSFLQPTSGVTTDGSVEIIAQLQLILPIRDNINIVVGQNI